MKSVEVGPVSKMWMAGAVERSVGLGLGVIGADLPAKRGRGEEPLAADCWKLAGSNAEAASVMVRLAVSVHMSESISHDCDAGKVETMIVATKWGSDWWEMCKRASVVVMCYPSGRHGWAIGGSVKGDDPPLIVPSTVQGELSGPAACGLGVACDVGRVEI